MQAQIVEIVQCSGFARSSYLRFSLFESASGLSVPKVVKVTTSHHRHTMPRPCGTTCTPRAPAPPPARGPRQREKPRGAAAGAAGPARPAVRTQLSLQPWLTTFGTDERPMAAMRSQKAKSASMKTAQNHYTELFRRFELAFSAGWLLKKVW